jgi:hypothetical protein
MNRNCSFTPLFSIFYILLSFLSFSFSQDQVTVIPIEKPDSEFGPIGFRINTGWMNGYLELRFPETLDCSEGMYFIDHYRPDMVPFSKVKKFPDWKTDKTTGAISYSYITDEGLEFGGMAAPCGDEVRMEFYANNKTGKRIVDMSPQICLLLKNSTDFDELKKLSDVFIYTDNGWMSLDKSTPSPADKGRVPMLVIGKRGFSNIQAVGKTKIPAPGGDIGDWWIINEESDEDIVYRSSKDGKHLAAISWPGDVSFLIYNSMNPCIHAGPSIQFTVEPGMERHWYGTIYLTSNNPDDLLKRYKDGRRPH